MWLILGGGAMIFAILNLVWWAQNKSSKWFGFISLSLTSLTMCACYSDEAQRVVAQDWGGLMDIMPTMSKALWICAIASILINAIPVFWNKKG